MQKNKIFKLVVIIFVINLEIESKRNYKHSEQELKLIKKVIITQEKCRKNEIPIVIHSAAQSSGKYFDRRQVSRNTWVKEAKEHQLKPIFVIGLPTDQRIQKELESEAKMHQDMIQFAFIDNYYNLTLKALSMLRWISKNCSKSAYVLKTDDDVIVNVPLLNDMLQQKAFADGLTGKMLTTRSNRHFGHKWYMPHNIYTHRFYRFLFGFSYVMSKNSVKRMYRKWSNFSDPVLDIDDLFITGILAQKARVRLFNDYRFNRYCGSDECYLERMISMHGCDSVNQTLNVWQYWKQNQCNNNWTDHWTDGWTDGWTNSWTNDFFNFRFSMDFYKK